MKKDIWSVIGLVVLIIFVFYISTLEEQSIYLKNIVTFFAVIFGIDRLISIINKVRPPTLEITRFKIIDKPEEIISFRKDVLNQESDEIIEDEASKNTPKKVYGKYPIIDLVIKNTSISNVTIHDITIEATRLNKIYDEPGYIQNNNMHLHFIGVSQSYNVSLDPEQGMQSVPVNNVTHDLSPDSSDRLCITVGHVSQTDSSRYPAHYYDAMYQIKLLITFNINNHKETKEKLICLYSANIDPWENKTISRPSENHGWNNLQEDQSCDDINNVYDDIKIIKQILNNLSKESLIDEKLEETLKFVEYIERKLWKLSALQRIFIDKEIKSIRGKINALKEGNQEAR